MIRLFANMVAGHIIIICLISLIFIFGALNQYVGYGFSPLSIGFTVFIYLIEILVLFFRLSSLQCSQRYSSARLLKEVMMMWMDIPMK